MTNRNIARWALATTLGVAYSLTTVDCAAAKAAPPAPAPKTSDTGSASPHWCDPKPEPQSSNTEGAPGTKMNDPSGASSSMGVTATSDVGAIHRALCQTIVNIQDLRDKYQGKDGHAGKIGIKHNWQTVFDGSIIGLGIASVASAFYGAPVPAIGGIAITASGLQQYRTYYNPSGEGLAYINAVKAARCVSTDAEYLLNDSPQPLWDAIKSLKTAIAAVQTSSAQLQAASTTSTLQGAEQTKATEQGQTGSDAAAAALTAANSALVAAIAEARAYNNGPATVDAAHDAIKDYIDQQLHRSTVDYSSLQTAVMNAIQSATTVESGVHEAQSSLLSAVAANGKASASAVT